MFSEVIGREAGKGKKQLLVYRRRKAGGVGHVNEGPWRR